MKGFLWLLGRWRKSRNLCRRSSRDRRIPETKYSDLGPPLGLRFQIREGDWGPGDGFGAHVSLLRESWKMAPPIPMGGVGLAWRLGFQVQVGVLALWSSGGKEVSGLEDGGHFKGGGLMEC